MLLSADVSHQASQLHVDLGQELGAHHADLVDDEPAPLQDALGDFHLLLRTLLHVASSFLHSDATSVVNGVACQL